MLFVQFFILLSRRESFLVVFVHTVHFNCRKKSIISRLCKHAVDLWLNQFLNFLFGGSWNGGWKGHWGNSHRTLAACHAKCFISGPSKEHSFPFFNYLLFNSWWDLKRNRWAIFNLKSNCQEGCPDCSLFQQRRFIVLRNAKKNRAKETTDHFILRACKFIFFSLNASFLI